MCMLLTSVTHFNFRVNLMSAVVARLSRRTWDEVRSFPGSSARITVLTNPFCRTLISASKR
jgi:hypothetical protein